MKNSNWVSIVWSFAAGCKSRLTLSVACAIISVAGGMIPYLGVYQLIHLFMIHEVQLRNIVFWSGVCLGGYGLKIISHAASTTLAHHSAYQILESMRVRIAERLMKAPLGTVQNESVGKLKNVMIDRVETIELPLAHIIPEGISNLLLPICVFAYLLFIDWRMAFAALITVPIAAISFAYLMKSFNKQYASYMESSNHVNSVIVEYVEGIEVIKTFNQSSSSYEKFEQAIQAFKDYTLGWFRSTWKLMNFSNAVLPSTLLGTVPIGMYLYQTGILGPSELAMCFILCLGIVGPLTSFTLFVNNAKTIEYAVMEVSEFLQLEALENASEQVQFDHYGVIFHDVSFSYSTPPQDAGSAQNKVLRSINLTFPEGSFTALVGPSGSGKSTIAKLIARFWDVTEGEISIGNVPLKQVPLDQLANTISYVSQDNFLFNCSLMDNIRLGNPDATDEEVIAAAKAACCHDFIEQLEHGYDSLAGEVGGKLSGGEKQRVAIARAMLKNAPIIILDEATAFTDPENEEKLQQSIAALTKEKSLFVIAHRLSTIQHADQIIVLNYGQIESTGSHNQLLQTCELYRHMWEAHIGAKAWSASSNAKEVHANG
ncbi:ABC transporter ATP-binding protein [Paenibacillus aceti]|uniref:ABC transporter ATP-binding protein n=1 Tax=Paenibacillus aceti TaxID=1820010 RepID=UPI000EA15712|nr:ABC transporter ATP-binding protein [Paenibacillus aceti]